MHAGRFTKTMMEAIGNEPMGEPARRKPHSGLL